MISSTPPTVSLLPLALPTSSETQNQRSLSVDTTSTSAADADQLALTSPAAETSLSGSSQQLSLQFRSHTHIRELPNGQTRTRIQTKLRFQYEFEAADGTSIRVHVKANLHFKQSTFGGDQAQSIKLSFKARVDSLREDVTQEISPLLDAEEVPSDTKQVVSQALSEFQQNADSAGNQFAETEPLDGDSLITSLVNAFNGLSQTLDSTAAGTAQSQLATTTREPASTSVPAPSETSELPPPSETTPEILVSPAEPEVASDGAQGARTVIRSAAFRARVRIIQSLRHMVDAFGDDSGVASRQASIWKLQITATQSVLSGANTTDTDAPSRDENNIDVQV
jgi:hypothetical protein